MPKRKVSWTHRSQELNLLLSLSPLCHPSLRVIRSSLREKRKSFCFLPSGFGILSPLLRSSLSPLPFFLLHPSLSLTLSQGLSLSVLVCVGVLEDSMSPVDCGSLSVVRESDRRWGSTRLLSSLASYPLPSPLSNQMKEGWWLGEGGAGTLLHIYTTPIPPCRHVCRSGPLLCTGCHHPTHTHAHLPSLLPRLTL